MLQNIRDRAQGWIAYVIIGLISIPFVLFGVNEYLGPDSEIYVAQVGDEKITQRQLNRLYQQRTERLRSQMGSAYRAGLFDEKMMRRSVLNNLIEQTQLIQAMRSAGFVIGDQQLAQRIHATEAFNQEGQFSQPLYERLISSIGYTSTGYEAEERSQMLLQQLSRGISASALPDSSETDITLSLRDQQREVSYLQISADAFKSDIEISESAIGERYEAQKSRYMLPEKVDLDYIELKVSALQALIDIDEATLEEAYQEQQAQFRSEEARRASHILILAEEGDDAADSAARSKAEDLLARIRSGESFTELAQANSDDPLSAPRGGDLGLIERNMMDAAFDEAAYALSEGEVSDLVRTSFGYHIIKLDKIEAAKQQSLAEVRDELLASLRLERAEKLFYEQMEDLANLAYENPESLEPAAEVLGLTIQSSGWMDRSGGGSLPVDPKITDAAFSKEVMSERVNSTVIELASDHVLVLRLKEYKAPEQRPLSEVSGAIGQTLLDEAIRARAVEQASALLARLASGESLQTLAAENGVTLHEAAWLGRDQRDHPAEVVTEAFRLPHPAEGSISRGTAELRNGDQAVVVVSALRSGDIAAVSADARAVLEQQLQNQRGEQLLNALIAELHATGEIKIFEENLE